MVEKIIVLLVCVLVSGVHGKQIVEGIVVLLICTSVGGT